MAAQANQAELEVYAARAGRNPGNSLLQYELGLRCKRAGKFKEAIQAFQAARDETRHKALVQLHLGESFQHIRNSGWPFPATRRPSRRPTTCSRTRKNWLFTGPAFWPPS